MALCHVTRACHNMASYYAAVTTIGSGTARHQKKNICSIARVDFGIAYPVRAKTALCRLQNQWLDVLP